ncbi:MAG: hypothetical protein N3A69_15750 [Leptospiraceae bacterium]|nr:hypothetical protein [Leptospiraceae bacterium]
MRQELMIGNKKFPVIQKAVLESSREIPTDTLTIELPKYRNLNKESIQIGDKVIWRAGYEKYGLKDEFVGYVTEIKNEVPFVVVCKDPMIDCQNKVMNSNFSGSIEVFISKCTKEKFNIGEGVPKNVNVLCANKSARYALWQLKKLYGLEVYFKGGVLYLHKSKLLEPNKITGSLPFFEFHYNIIESSLVPRIGLDFKVTVRSEEMKTGQVIKQSYGTGKQEKVYEIDNLDSKQALERAKQLFLELCGEGFTGSFITFGYPSLEHSEIIEIRHPEEKSMNAKCFINEVKKTFDCVNSSFRQEVFPGAFVEPPKKIQVQNVKQKSEDNKEKLYGRK